MMSEKLGIDSSLVLSERCTSTPVGVNRLSFSRLMESSVGEFDNTRADDPSTPKMNISAVPIFGRRNLQLLKGYNQNRDNQPSVIKIQTLPKQKLPLDVINVEKTFEDQVQASSSGFDNKKDSKGIKTKIVQRNKRRSNHNESQMPIFKVKPKCPKSPRLLTAMRSQLRANRDKLKNQNVEMVKENEKKTCQKKQENCMKPIRSAGKPPSTTVYNRYKLTVPVSPKLSKKKRSPKA